MHASTAPEIATLAGATASRVAKDCFKLSRGSGKTDAFLVAVAASSSAEAALITDILSVLKTHLTDDRESRQHVLQTLLPTRLLSMTPAVLEQVNRNAAAQAELADEFGLLTSAQVAKLAGSTASNRAATGNRWVSQRKVFTVDVDGAQRFPGFQFGENNRPLPIVAEVLAAVGDKLVGWELALWFTGSSDRLGGQRPVDVLDSDPDLVGEAARRLADEILV